MNKSGVSNRVALVTGASRGIGRATALRLARGGASVAVNYASDTAGARSVVAEIVGEGGEASAYQADVSDKSAVRTMVETITRELGPIEILVNNAAIARSGELLSYSEEDFDRMWQVNVKGILHTTGAVAPGMIASGYGRIINVSSIAALGTSLPGTTLYAATKGAVLSLTKRMALELGPKGITANAVLPGFVLTDMTTRNKSPEELQKKVAALSRNSMLGRAGQPDDLARVICFLASEESGFMTGQFLSVDGGRTDYLTHS